MTTSGYALRANRVSSLRWLAPAGTREIDFAPVRARLADLLSRHLVDPIYSAKRRSIYLVEDAVLGRVAIKEMRNESTARRIWFRHVRFRSALREFRVGSAFQARGGRTPGFLGAALDCNLLAMRRVVLFIRWLDGVQTLTDYLRPHAGEPPDELFDLIAESLVAAARLGLVHGRHSSENILVDASGEVPVFHAIDFAYSRLERGFADAGFVRDVARIAQWLSHEEICSEAALRRFFSRVAGRAWPDSRIARARAEQMSKELRRWRQRLERKNRTQERRERTT